MVKTVLSSSTIAFALGDDLTGLLQVSTEGQPSQGQRILAAVAKEGSTICVEAAAGDVAPVAGSYIATMSQQAVEVAAGSVAPQAGSFCVPKQDVLFMQRTYGLHTARDFEVALGNKKDEPKEPNFDEEPHKYVSAQQCPEKAALLQAMDATAARKDKDKGLSFEYKGQQRRVCQCRSFLKNVAAEIADTKEIQEIQKLVLPQPEAQLFQRNFDAALASKKKVVTTTTTTTTTSIDLATSPDSTDLRTMAACATASQLSVEDFGSYGMVGEKKLPTWALVAKLLNDPAVTTKLFKANGITEGWQYCDQRWAVDGACRPYVKAFFDQKEARRKACAVKFSQARGRFSQMTNICKDGIDGCSTKFEKYEDRVACEERNCQASNLGADNCTNWGTCDCLCPTPKCKEAKNCGVFGEFCEK